MLMDAEGGQRKDEVDCFLSNASERPDFVVLALWSRFGKFTVHSPFFSLADKFLHVRQVVTLSCFLSLFCSF